MTLVTPAGTALCTMVFQQDGVINPQISTFGLDLGGALVTPTYEIADDVATAWIASLRDEQYGDVQLQYITLKDNVHFAGSAPMAYGTKSGSAGDAWSTAIVKKTTGLVGRQNTGRMFLPGFLDNADVLTNGTVLPGRPDEITIAGNTFLSELDTAGYKMLILHTEGGPHEGESPAEVQALICSPNVGVQRRRRDTY